VKKVFKVVQGYPDGLLQSAWIGNCTSSRSWQNNWRRTYRDQDRNMLIVPDCFAFDTIENAIRFFLNSPFPLANASMSIWEANAESILPVTHVSIEAAKQFENYHSGRFYKKMRIHTGTVRCNNLILTNKVHRDKIIELALINFPAKTEYMGRPVKFESKYHRIGGDISFAFKSNEWCWTDNEY
jgi:hypothetical protein